MVVVRLAGLAIAAVHLNDSAATTIAGGSELT